MTTDTLTREEALAFGKKWVQDRAIPTEQRWAISQFNWLQEQLAAKCIAEGLKQGDDEWELEKRLDSMHELLVSIQSNARPKRIQDLLWKDPASLDDTERRRAEEARHLIWKRHDPKISFTDGLDSDHMPSVFKDDLKADCAIYLERPWLRHPVLDWMLVDMLVTAETALFGEHIKEFLLPFPKDILGMNKRYHPARGNLVKMQKVNWEELGERLWIKAFWTLIVPIGAIVAAFYFGWEGTGASLLGLYGTFIAGWIGWKVLKGILRLLGKGAAVDPMAKIMKLWGEMCGVWALLEGPVINPSQVKEALAKSRDNGAVWDAPVFSIIDRVVAADPAVWIVKMSRD